MAAVAAFELGAGVPGGFVLFDFVEGVVGLCAPAHAVEDEEFWLRTKVGGIAQTRSLQVGFGALGDGAWIAVVGLAIAGLDHIAGQDQRGFFKEGIDVGAVRVRNQLHVGGFDALPAGNRRAVEGMARNELVFVKVRDRHRGVLLLATGIGKTEVNELDFVFLHHLHHICNGLGHQVLLGKALVEKSTETKQVACQPHSIPHYGGAVHAAPARSAQHIAPKRFTRGEACKHYKVRTNSGPISAPISCRPCSNAVQPAGTKSWGPFTPSSIWRPYWG